MQVREDAGVIEHLRTTKIIINFAACDMQIIQNSVGNAKITGTALFSRNDIGLRWCTIAILLLVPAHVGKQEITQA